MATNPVCLTDYVIDLSSEYLENSPGTASELAALDVDGDGMVDADEAEGVVLAAPVSDSSFRVISADDLAFYDRLMQQAWDAARFARFSPAARDVAPRKTAEAWLLDLRQSSDTGEITAHVFGTARLTLVDAECYPDRTELLWRTGEENQTHEFHFAMSVPDDLSAGFENAVTVTINEETFTVADLIASSSVPYRNLARRIFDVLYMSIRLNPRKFPDGFPERVRDELESSYYRGGELEEEPLPEEKKSVEPSAASPVKFELSFGSESSSDDPLPVRKKRVEDNANPVIAAISVLSQEGVPYEIGVRVDATEKPLGAEELRRVDDLMGAVSPSLYGVFAVSGVMDGFTVEIVEDDVFDEIAGRHALGLCFPWLRKFAIRRSSLAGTGGFVYLRDVFTHELAHGIFSGEAGDPVGDLGNEFDYFMEDAWRDAKARAGTEFVFPSVSIYSLKNAREFFAESTLAYLSGEAGTSGISDNIHGHKSRAELREKLPEVYLAMRLLFDADSPFFGNLNVFSWDAKAFYEDLLVSSERDRWLSPGTSAKEIASAWEY